MKRFVLLGLLTGAFLASMMSGVASAQTTYPPSPPPPTVTVPPGPPTALTGSNDIVGFTVVAIVLAVLGLAVLLVARRRARRVAG
jgi:hypothetical protein